MINRIIIRTFRTNYINSAYWCSYVTFEGLEPKTKLRLLAIGYCPAIEITCDNCFSFCYHPMGIMKMPPYHVHNFSEYPAIP